MLAFKNSSMLMISVSENLFGRIREYPTLHLDTNFKYRNGTFIGVQHFTVVAAYIVI